MQTYTIHYTSTPLLDFQYKIKLTDDINHETVECAHTKDKEEVKNIIERMKKEYNVSNVITYYY